MVHRRFRMQRNSPIGARWIWPISSPTASGAASIGALPPRLAALRLADAARPADRHVAALLALRVERRAGRSRRPLGPVRCGSRSALSRCAARAASITISSTATSTAQVERTRLRPLASGRVERARRLGADRRPVRDRAGRPAPTQPAGCRTRARQHRAGRRLSVHEADHLVAAGVARAGVQLGRAGRLAGGHRQPSTWPPFAAVARQHRLGDRLRHALRDPGQGGRCAGRGEIDRAAVRYSARRSPSACSMRSRCLLWAAAIWTVRPDWFALAALVPAALHLASQALRADSDRRRRWRSACSARTASRACWSFSPCWSSAFRRARRLA